MLLSGLLKRDITIHKELLLFLKDIYERRYLIFQLAKREVKSTYAGSFLGPVWVLLEPLAFMMVLWLFFGIGLRGRGNSDVGGPFVVYLMLGMTSYFFFSQVFRSSTTLMRNYSYLVRRADFRLGILPIVNILSDAVSHVALLFVVLLISIFNDVSPSVYYLQLLYYLFAMNLLLLGLGWLVSAFNVFVEDTGKVVKVLTQFGFWGTPLFWNINIVPADYQWLLKLNPMFYIVMGYRDCVMYRIWFWEKPYMTLYYWDVCLFFLFTGAIVFKRLRPHFSHVI